MSNIKNLTGKDVSIWPHLNAAQIVFFRMTHVLNYFDNHPNKLEIPPGIALFLVHTEEINVSLGAASVA